MSSDTAIKSPGLLAIAALLGLFLLWQYPPTGEVDSYSSSPERGLASVTGKAAQLNFKSAPLLRHTSKLKGPVSVTLSHADSDNAIVAGNPFTLEARVLASETLDNVHLKWVLPEGVRLNGGQTETTLAQVVRDEPQTISVTLVSDVEDNQQVHLHVSATLRGMTFGESAQFNTTDQEYLELQKAELLERAEKDMAKQAPSQQKIFH